MNTLLTKDYHKTKNKSLKFLTYVRYNIKKNTLEKKTCHRLRKQLLKKMFTKDRKHKKMILLHCKLFVLFKLEKYFRNREIIKMIYCTIL